MTSESERAEWIEFSNGEYEYFACTESHNLDSGVLDEIQLNIYLANENNYLYHQDIQGPMSDKAKNPVKAIEKTISLIEVLRVRESARVTELAQELQQSKGTVHNHLSTLREHGYVIKNGNEYRLSLKFLNIGGFLRKELELYRTAEPEVQRLAEETDELANLMTEELGRGIHLYRAKGNMAVNLDTYAGLSTHLNTTALGKAILACLPTDRVDTIIQRHGLPKRTEDTITDQDELFDELETIRDQGYAIDDEEHVPGLRCIAAPIKTTNGGSLGAISVSAPTNRLKGDLLEDEIPNLVRSAANVVELSRNYE